MSHKMARARYKKLGLHFIRYGMVAILALGLEMGLLYGLTAFCRVYYLASATIAFIISLLFNYVLSSRWAFGKLQTRAGREPAYLLAFLLIGLVGLLLNDAFMWVFTSMLGIYFMFSKLLTVIFVFFWSFLARYRLFDRGIPLKSFNPELDI